MSERVFDTDKRIRVGIWGLGRGRVFYELCKSLNMDVVAGCDYNPVMQAHFQQHNPGAAVTGDADEFLRMDFDAVILATYATDHGPDAIRCLEAGKHVLSEVTSFHTMAQGVQLVETVERTGLTYNLAENYPWSKPNMYLAELWRRGLMGEFQYAEYEYLHNCRILAYTYIDGNPIVPGYNVHYWRTWLNFHYYNTHSLGPVMYITDLRPTRVVALPCNIGLPGYPPPTPMLSMGTVTPSLISFENGGLMRNLMGATMMDGHDRRIWGTRGAARVVGSEVELRLGGGQALRVKPDWPRLGALAAKAGHGGGDFWVLYQFANEILNGEPSYFDVYRSAACTAAGILAFRSAMEGGVAYDIPDFRNPAERDKWRNDHFAQERFPADGCFSEKDRDKARRFSTIAANLVRDSELCAATAAWLQEHQRLASRESVASILDTYFQKLPAMRENFEEARALIAMTPGSRGAAILSELIAAGEMERTLSDAFVREVQTLRQTIVQVANTG